MQPRHGARRWRGLIRRKRRGNFDAMQQQAAVPRESPDIMTLAAPDRSLEDPVPHAKAASPVMVLFALAMGG